MTHAERRPEASVQIAMTKESLSAVQPAGSPDLPFDSVICFGAVDWWYHNRGHFDLQILRELTGHVPVLYVNSIGMRFPQVSEGAVFGTRILRKLRSMGRGLTPVRDRFAVYSPLSVPGRVAQRLSAPLLALQVRRAAGRLGFRAPLLWISNPAAWGVVGRLGERGLVYCRTDRYEAFPGVHPERIARCDLSLKGAADVTFFCATALFRSEGGQCGNAAFVDHGVDFEAFAKGAEGEEPEDLRGIPRPRVGFIGSIDAHTFDAELFTEIVDRLPGVQFVLVGGSTLPPGWLERLHVHFLGQKPYDQVSSYPGHCDVLIMPWNQGPWIQSCNPVKLKEYLAAGRPVVTTWFDELRRYEGCVRVARDADSFVAAIRAALADPAGAAERLRNRVRDETWTRQAETALDRVRAALAARSGG